MSLRELPDLLAVGVLIYAFVSVARPVGGLMPKLWLLGWICVELHFIGYSFLEAPGYWGIATEAVGTAALVWCAELFRWSLDPQLDHRGGRLLFWAMSLVYSVYIFYGALPGVPAPLLLASACVFALLPAVIVAFTPRSQRPPGRWIVVAVNVGVSVALVLSQSSPHASDLMQVVPLFATYFTCALQFTFYRPRTTGGFVVTLVGLLAWSSVFPLGMAADILLPANHIAAEVWNLPKYLVAVGMILLLLETQLTRNHHLAHHDVLTGLPNRRLFENRILSAMDRARRSEGAAALLAIDLDGFKAVNDELGHHAGDEVLQRVAQRFSAYLRNRDTIARTGGDEFSIVLEAPLDRDEATRIAFSLRQVLEAPLEVAGRHMRVGASIGVAMFPDDAQTPHLLSVLADERMYIAKREGGSRVQAC